MYSFQVELLTSTSVETPVSISTRTAGAGSLPGHLAVASYVPCGWTSSTRPWASEVPDAGVTLAGSPNSGSSATKQPGTGPARSLTAIVRKMFPSGGSDASSWAQPASPISTAAP